MRARPRGSAYRKTRSGMSEIVVACVNVGTKYPVEYVRRLRRMVARHLPIPHRFICLTDRVFGHEPGIGCQLIGQFGLPGWWSKMCLFRPEWREGKTVIYLDLDTVIIGDMTPLTGLTDEFHICANFTKAAGHPDWPCRYGSCVMVVPEGKVPDLWKIFWEDRRELMANCAQYGDQLAIEALEPNAKLLQDHLPERFFMGRRELMSHKVNQPSGTSMIVFAGPMKPHNCGIKWVHDAWTGK